MARIYTEGFEMQDFVGVVLANFGASSGAINTATKRSGLASWQQYAGSNGWSTGTKGLPSAAGEMYFRFGVYIASSSVVGSRLHFKWMKGATELGSVRVQMGGPITVFNTSANLCVTGTTIILPDTWYLVEVHVKIADSPNGLIELKVEGGPVEATFTGDTQPGADTTIDTFQFYAGTSYMYAFMDDLAVNDTSGGADNSWCGDGRIIKVYPNGTVTNQLTGQDADTVNNHLNVDEFPLDSDTTYNQGTVVDQEDLYDLTACGLNDVTETIQRIWAESRSRDTVAAGGTCALITKASGGSEVSGGDVVLATTYTVRVLSAAQKTNPVSGVAWTAADIDALQAGVRTRS
jgi:hypothetical protein